MKKAIKRERKRFLLTKIRKKKLKRFFIKVGMLSAVLMSAFIYGTFQPNFYVEKIYHKQIEEAVEQNNVVWENRLKNLNLQEPSFEYTNDETFVQAIYQCVDYLNLWIPRDQRIPKLLVAAQAALESEWGRSYFATEGNALFGVKTYDLTKLHLKPRNRPNVKWGVASYETKCESVAAYISLLNTGTHYEKFREVRANGGSAYQLADTLIHYSENGDYAKLVKRIIKKLDK